MDLKKSNVMIMKDLQVKLIDFTESFHPKVCKESIFSNILDYDPGFSMPYASPEVFDRRYFKEYRAYNWSQDMFSFGILCHNLLFERYPFEVN